MTPSHPLQVIPVVDLADDQVVRGIRGERAAYRPIVSTLVAGSDPLDIAAALLRPDVARGAPRRPLYVADLDAIQGGSAQLGTLRRLLQRRADLDLWLDAGLRDVASGAALKEALGADGERVRLVYGSESLVDARGLADDPRAILSLDCRLARPLDPAGLWSRPALWPRTLVVMTLDRVGTAAGPDLATLPRLRALAPGRDWVGAGGIRDAGDLRSAATTGASAWLVASALHDGTLQRE